MIGRRTPARTRSLLAGLAALALVFAGVNASTGRAGAATSSSMPYSDPVWYPLHVATKVGCIGPGGGTHNGGSTCAHDHLGYFGININVVPSSGRTYPKAGVYAAGAGRVVTALTSVRCTSATTSAGNYVAIDHGAGVVSLYEHLSSSVAVKVGQLVSAGQLLGYASNTGTSCSANPYTDFVVRTDGGGYQDLTQTITTLRACVPGRSATSSQTWPGALPGRYSTWVQVPYLTSVPASVGGCGQSSVPKTYATPGIHPASTTTGRATISWSATRATATEIQQQIYRPSSKSWDIPCSPNSARGCTAGYAQVRSGVTSYTASGLISKRLYRFRISRRNAVGWSVWSSWSTVTVR